jgi:AcrR family transcriptional regulator
MNTPRNRRRQRIYTAILEAARDIITEQGADNLTMRAIAEHIDYSQAGLYEYFDSKEEILQVLCGQGHALLRDALLQVSSDQPPADHLLELGLAYIKFALSNPDYYMLMFTLSFSSANQEDMLNEESSYSVLLSVIQRGLVAGVFKPRPGFGLSEMAYAAWSIVHGISMLRLTHLSHFPANFDEVDRQALKAFGQGLMVAGGSDEPN